MTDRQACECGKRAAARTQAARYRCSVDLPKADIWTDQAFSGWNWQVARVHRPVSAFSAPLAVRAANADNVHICDRGSAMHLFQSQRQAGCSQLPQYAGGSRRTGQISEMQSSLLGHLFRIRIRRGLRHATQVACVSQFTLDNATRLLQSDANLIKVQMD